MLLSLQALRRIAPRGQCLSPALRMRTHQALPTLRPQMPRLFTTSTTSIVQSRLLFAAAGSGLSLAAAGGARMGWMSYTSFCESAASQDQESNAHQSSSLEASDSTTKEAAQEPSADSPSEDITDDDDTSTTISTTTTSTTTTEQPRQLPSLVSTSGGIWMWVLRAASEDWFLYLAASFASVGMALCGVQTSSLFGEIFEHFNDTAAIGEAFASGAFWKPVRKLLLLFTVQFGLNFCATSVLARATNNLGQRLRRSYFAAILRQDTEFFDHRKTGEMMQHLGEDIGAITTATRQSLTTGIRSMFDIVLGGYAMYHVRYVFCNRFFLTFFFFSSPSVPCCLS